MRDTYTIKEENPPPIHDLPENAQDVLEAMGNRRSIRWFEPAEPVEEWKIQTMLEAALTSATVGNYNGTGCVVLYRDRNPEIWEYISDWSQITTQTAPVGFFWYYDMAFYDTQGQSVHDLLRVGAADKAHGWDEGRVLNMFPLPQVVPDFINHRMAAVDCGKASMNAAIAGEAVGVKTCFTGFGGAAREGIEEELDLPDTANLVWGMLAGYPAENPKAGGQRPRRNWDLLFHQGEHGSPFPRSQQTKELLKDAHLIQEKAPLEGRRKELNTLTKRFGLGDEYLTDWKLEESKMGGYEQIEDPPLQHQDLETVKQEVQEHLYQVTPTVKREEADEYLEEKEEE